MMSSKQASAKCINNVKNDEKKVCDVDQEWHEAVDSDVFPSRRMDKDGSVCLPKSRREENRTITIEEERVDDERR
jgi:hypothetical protein